MVCHILGYTKHPKNRDHQRKALLSPAAVKPQHLANRPPKMSVFTACTDVWGFGDPLDIGDPLQCSDK